MRVVLQAQGIEIECSCDEFQSIYPKLMNGDSDTLHKSSRPRIFHRRTGKDSEELSPESVDNGKVNAQKPRHQKSKERRQQISDATYYELLQKLAWQYGYTTFQVSNAVKELKMSAPRALYYAVARAVDEGVIEKNGKAGFKFRKLKMIVVKQVKENKKESSGNGSIVSEEKFKEMLLEAKPLLEQGCSNSQLYKLFRSTQSKIIDEFLRQALSKGIIKEDLDTFTLTKPTITV